MRRHLTTLVSLGQDAVVRGIQTWAETVQRLSKVPDLPGTDLTTAVDAVFDLAEQVLATQRDISKAVLRAVSP